MAREVFYRKYRSRGFADIVGQEHVTRTLRNAVRTGRLSHAYLFCGPRGVGKTSAARVLAKAVNCLNPQEGEPCHQCQACITIAAGRCMDVIEIDAASNNSVDDIRDLREKVGYAPSEVRMKFYILDEAHMLSSSACNAILKTLEEPPPHVTFILATTETEKIIPTIMSRCQRFDFHRIPLAEVVERLRYICEQESLEIPDDVLEYIGRLSTGSLRDAESLLDQMVTYFGSGMTVEQVQSAIGTTGSDKALHLASLVIQGDTPGAIRMVNQAMADGVDLRQLNRSLVEMLRGVLITKLTGEPVGLLELTPEGQHEVKQLAKTAGPESLLDIVRIFTRVESAQRGVFPPQLPLEMAIVESAMAREKPTPTGSPPAEKRQSPPTRTASPPQHRAADAAAVAPQIPVDNQPETAPVHQEGEEVRTRGATAPLEEMRPRWKEVLEILGKRDRMLQAMVKESHLVELNGDELVLAFRYPYHRGRVEVANSKRMVEQALSEVMGTLYHIRCIVQEQPTATPAGPADDPMVRTALSMGARIRRVVGPDEKAASGKDRGGTGEEA
jgi:DNA polymerase-3 subunit gamma/tau